MATAVASGTITSGVFETAVASGGQVLTLTLTGDVYVSTAVFSTIRQDILDGITSDASTATSWNTKVRDTASVSTVVRTSDTICTVTFAIASTYNTNADEDITATLPATALVSSVVGVAANSFTVLKEPTNMRVIHGFAPVAPGVVDYTDPGFGAPDAALVMQNITTAGVEISTTHAWHCIGFVDNSGNDEVMSVFMENNVGNTDASRAWSSGNVVTMQSNSTTYVLGAGALIKDGLRINYSISSTAYNVIVILLKGLKNVKVASQALSAGVTDITGLGFSPDLIFLATTAQTVQGRSDYSYFSFGAAHKAADGTISQHSTWLFEIDNAAQSYPGLAIYDTYAVGKIAAGGTTIDWSGAVEDFDSDGFSINASATDPGSQIIDYLAIELHNPDDAWVGTIETPTSAIVQNITGPRFTPGGIILTHTWQHTLNSHVWDADACAFIMGASDGTDEYSMGIYNEDAQTVTDTASYYGSSILARLYDDNAAIRHFNASATFTPVGFDLAYTSTGTSSLVWAAIALRDLSVGVVSATTSGTLVGASVFEDAIVSGGRVLKLTLAEDVYVSTAVFSTIRQDIIDGLESDSSTATSWNTKVRDTVSVSAVVRTSDTLCTITLPAIADYDISTNETITATLPATAMASTVFAVIAAPTILIRKALASSAVQTTVCTIFTGF